MDTILDLHGTKHADVFRKIDNDYDSFEKNFETEPFWLTGSFLKYAKNGSKL